MQSETPIYSVVVPTRNNAHTLKRTIDSVLAQTLDDFELIIVENGSTDETPALVQSLAARDSRITTILDGPIGAGPARNAGIEVARGEWIAFLDADDTWSPDFLERMSRVTKKHPGHALYACNGRISYRRLNASVTWGLRHKLPHRLDATTMAWMSVLPGQVILRTDAVREVGGYEYRRGEETDLWLRILIGHSGYWVPYSLYQNYQDPTGTSRQRGYRQAVGQSLGDSLVAHADEVPDAAGQARLLKRAQRWYAFSEAAEKRERLEGRMAVRDYSGARRTYLSIHNAYQSRWRYILGLPLMMLSPRLFARYTGAGYVQPVPEP